MCYSQRGIQLALIRMSIVHVCVKSPHALPRFFLFCFVFPTDPSSELATRLFSPQTIALHQELHPHAPICVLHAQSYKYFREGCRALLWISLGEHGKSHGGRPQVHHWSAASQQNTVCKCTNTLKTSIDALNIKYSVLERIFSIALTRRKIHTIAVFMWQYTLFLFGLWCEIHNQTNLSINWCCCWFSPNKL